MLRKRGSTYIGDYDDDLYVGLDLQQDVLEGMNKVVKVHADPRDRDPSLTRCPVRLCQVGCVDLLECACCASVLLFG